MVTIRTVSGTPEGEVIRTMKITPDRKEEWKSLKETVKEKARKFKTLGELKEGFMYDVGEKSKKKAKKRRATIRKTSSVIEGIIKRKQVQARQNVILRRKLYQERMKRRMEAEQIAQQQRAGYEQPDNFAGYQEPQQEQLVEEEHNQEMRRPSFFEGMFNRLRPNPGMLDRIRSIGSVGAGGNKKRNIRNRAQIGTRHVAGDGPIVKAPRMVAPRLSFFGRDKLNKTQHNLKW